MYFHVAADALLLELLIDPACSIVFEAEPEADGLMERAPRPVADSPFAAAPLLQSVLQGLGMAAALLAGQAWLTEHGFGVAQGRGVVFGTLVLGVMLLIWANRDLSRPAWYGITDRNPWLWRMAAAMGLLLAATLGLPWLRQIMGMALPGVGELVAGAGMLTACVVWLESMRLTGVYKRRTSLTA
ncbi:MAG TPA: cation-translocating P-type ATPase C-terminal domain-containing protein [Rhodoferax sp.]|nr:cation-translocating P-type ATPase C-terminal domain-containing protein [Rhodoferax sp.]